MDGKIKINKNGYEINGDLESEQILLAEKLSKLSYFSPGKMLLFLNPN